MLIAIIDDHKLFASGLALLLEELSDDVVVECFTSVSALLDVESREWQLLILDFYLPGHSFSDSYLALTQNVDCPVVVVSASPSPADEKQALACGAAAFINKQSEPDELLSSLREVLDGDGTTSRVSEISVIAQNFQDFSLTERQIEILLLVAKGYTNKEIANAFEISPETVKSHMKSIFRSIEVQNRTEAIGFVRQFGLF